MKDQSKFILFVSLIIIAGLLLTTIDIPIKIQEDGYGTGLSANTTSQFEIIKKGKKYRENCIALQGRTPIHEILVRDKYVVSWQSENGKSQLITSRADFTYQDCGAWIDWGPIGGSCGHLYGVALQYYYVMVDYTSTDGSVTTIINTKENVYDYDYIELARSFGTNYHDGQGYDFPNADYEEGLYHYELGVEKHDCRGTGKNKRNWIPERSDIQTETLEFYMKGTHVGKITVKYYANKIFRNRETDDWLEQLDCDACRWETLSDVLLATDECYLVAGGGTIDILSTNAVGNVGTEEVIHSDESITETYTKYVYEEGQTVRISVDTGFSGQSLTSGDIGPDGNVAAGKGWFLNIYGPDGRLKETTPLDDNLRGYIHDYTIPTESFGVGENEFRVVLANALFDQAETRLFVVKSLASIPGRPLVKTFDEEGHETTKFKQGDRVVVQAQALANSDGTGDIAHFKCIVKYDTASGVRYAFGPSNVAAIKESGNSYYCRFSFQLSSDIINVGDVYIRIHAVDSIGQAGPEYEGNIFSEQVIGNYKITILTLTDGSPVSGATCTFTKADGTKTTRVSNSEGRAVFGLDGGMWSVEVKKDGYYPAELKDIQVKDDATYPINMKPMWFPVDYTILIVIIVIALIGVGAMLYQAHRKGKIDLSKIGKIFRRKR